jgi:hypothetical protein
LTTATTGARRSISTSEAYRSLRVLAALLVAAAGAIHLYLWFDFFHRVHLVGVLFLANAAAGLLLALWLLASRGLLALIAGAGFAVATLAAFLVATRWGLFGYHERFWGPWQLAAGVVELAALLLTAGLAAARIRSGSARRRRRAGRWRSP